MDLKITEDAIFQNAHHEQASFDDICLRIENFIKAEPKFEYVLSVGTDSMTYDKTWFVLAIVLHRVGNGGIYFYKKIQYPAVKDLKDKLYKETQLSLDTVEILTSKLIEKDIDKLRLSIHLDIGKNGPTKDLIKELEGWVEALGYECEIKPNSYAASTIANRYSK